MFFSFDLQTHEVNKVSRATYEQAMVVWKCLIGGIPPTNLMVLSKSFNIFSELLYLRKVCLGVIVSEKIVFGLKTSFVKKGDD